MSATTNPILPCEQQPEVVSLAVTTVESLPPREIISSKWLTEDNIEIKSTLPERQVKIELETRGIPDGDKLDVKITDKKNNSMKDLAIKVDGNKAVSDLFLVEENWLHQVLQIKVEKI